MSIEVRPINDRVQELVAPRSTGDQTFRPILKFSFISPGYMSAYARDLEAG